MSGKNIGSVCLDFRSRQTHEIKHIHPPKLFKKFQADKLFVVLFRSRSDFGRSLKIEFDPSSG